MGNNLIYVIKKEEHNEESLKKIIKKHKEIKFVFKFLLLIFTNVVFNGRRFNRKFNRRENTN